MTGKVYLICGRICAGKTHYAVQLTRQHNAVRLSVDELMTGLFHHREGEHHDALAKDAHAYLHRKAVEILRTGTNVVLDWGFWSREERQRVSAYYAAEGIAYEWHSIILSDEQWKRNIESRNRAVLAGETADYYVDEGLLQKLASRFEAPEKDEMDVWHVQA